MAGCRRAVPLSLLLGLFQAVFGIVDFTCVTKPRIDINNENTFIAGYLHGNGRTLSFIRVIDTYTSVEKGSLKLPSQAKEKKDRPTAQEGETISIRRMPASDTKQRIGAFACKATKTPGDVTTIQTIIMSKNADFLPTRVSQTVNLGDAVNLTVTVTDSIRNYTRWRKNGSEVIDERSNHTFYNLGVVDASNTGIYEVHFAGERSNGRQALMRLIVRGCHKNKWNPPLCERECPTCFNGGVCGDRTGDCICPPGFSGYFCEKPEGPNRFGQSGSFRCDSPELGGGPTCTGMLFCLPDPYGCSCAAGYQGIDCNEMCDDGFYGADCAQVCHCMEGVSCNGTTGECHGDCALGFTGINCQVCDNNTYGHDCRLCHCMEGVSCNGTTGECHGDCAPGFTGINCQEKCLPFNGSKASCHTTCTDFLDPAMKSFAPQNVAIISTLSNKMNKTFTWHPVNCTNGIGIVNYVYMLKAYGNRQEPEPVRIDSSLVSVPVPLCGVPYEFQVAAETTKGIGPFSSTHFSTYWSAPDAVAALTNQGTSKSGINLSWTTSRTSQNYSCPAFDYLVTFTLKKLDHCGEVHNQSGLVNTTNTSISLQGLKAYSIYDVSVTPRNDIGNGSSSPLQITTGETRPGAAPEINSSSSTINSITWTWNTIPCGKRGGKIIGYQTRLKRSNVRVDRMNVSTTSVKYTGLLACTRYTVSVWAYTKAGRGERSNDTRLTKTDVPEPVLDLNVLGHLMSPRQDEFHVHWTAPGGDCCATSYNVSYELIELDHCDSELTSPATTAFGTVKDINVTIRLPAHYSKYRVHVAPINGAGEGNRTSISINTSESTPNAAPVLRSAASNDSITFSWDPIPCGSRRGNITHFEYRFRGSGPQGKDKATKKKNVTQPSVTFRDLSPCTNYSIRVRAYTNIGHGPWTNWTVQDTVIIDEIQSFNLQPFENKIHASWITAGDEDNPCPVTSYLVSYQLVNLEQCEQQSNPELMSWGVVVGSGTNITSVHAYSTYIVQVVPANNAAEKFIQMETITTDEGVPLASPEPNEVFMFNQSVRVSWYHIPCGKRGGNITGYSYELLDVTGSLVNKGHTEADSVVVDGLAQGASYSFKLWASTRVGLGPPMSIRLNTPIDASKPPVEASSANAVVVVVVVLLAVVFVLLVAVIVRKRRQEGEKPLSVIADQDEVGLQNLPSTSAARSAEISTDQSLPSANLPKSTDEMPVGNVPSKAGPSTASTDSLTPGPSSNAPVTKPKPYVKPYAKTKLKASAKTSQSFPQVGPVAMAHLAEYIKRKTSEKISGFQQDYESIPGEHLHSWSVAKQDHNKRKNRYNNILAYDHSRVVLECLEDNPQSDYINASYINGYKHESKYIACQGPTKASVNDMWRMVWQERVGKIVMLTNLIENGKGKCEQYWPDEGGKDYGELFVRKVDESSHSNFIVRTFHLSKSSEPEGEYRELIHFQYITWPDMKLPESSPLLRFIMKIRATDLESTQHGPIVVHCSAGVGRTGTFISVDSMLDMAEAEGQVDVLKFVRDMREQRFLMVQTLEQYKFIFDALLESSLSENTAFKADQFHQHYAKLKKRDKRTGTNSIQAQFQMLESFTASWNEDQCIGGRNAANVDKNRFKDCIPKDNTRPYLMTKGDEGSTNYINATFLNGHKGKNAYLATQAPLPNTVGDIWRMVFDYKSFCIVMLNSINDDPSVVQYWPEDCLQFGPLTVTLKREDQHSSDIIIRQFDVSYPLRKSDEVQSVCQIQYLGWPSRKEVPNSPSSLLKVLEAVKMWTRDHPDGPITVHCIDGVGCSGTFCALLSVVDHLEKEKIVDVFQAVKKLRTTRAGMVNTLAQYQFCYQVVQTYLDSSSIYENYR
ncbi:receptor-type tyrosine-protein phosphatase T-like isoform X2 [Acanthaster planci]|uniref:protein-tyrosine-phosphatase n=1 Tax=Acanthaster planci TaxID=133434 RepID=A0A8B7YXI3_ACAPL|nr:receptor-type tyrosine-protein phosphatase T-like isoform X2 [Acanthaster planci]